MTSTKEPRLGQETRSIDGFTVHPRLAELYDKLSAIGAHPVVRAPGDWIGADCQRCRDGCRMILMLGFSACPHGCHWSTQ